CTSEDADTDFFPANTPVQLTDVYAGIAKAGEKGTLAQTLDAIADQTNPLTIIVRVDEGEDDAETKSNIIGTTTANGRKTGMQALLTAQQRFGYKPRILGVPGFDDEDVATSMNGIAEKLRAFNYTYANGCDTIDDVTTYRENFGAREQMLIWPNFTGFDTA